MIYNQIVASLTGFIKKKNLSESLPGYLKSSLSLVKKKKNPLSLVKKTNSYQISKAQIGRKRLLKKSKTHTFHRFLPGRSPNKQMFSSWLTLSSGPLVVYIMATSAWVNSPYWVEPRGCQRARAGQTCRGQGQDGNSVLSGICRAQKVCLVSVSHFEHPKTLLDR